MKKTSTHPRPFAKVKLLILDVDGVMTEGGIGMDDRGAEHKVFNVRDGSGIVQLRKAGVPVAFLSGRKSDVVYHRAEELGVEIVIQGQLDKLSGYKVIRDRHKVKDREVCYIGDDVLDVPVLKKVGASVAPADAHPSARSLARYVTTAGGGRGAVREVADRILAERGLKPKP